MMKPRCPRFFIKNVEQLNIQRESLELILMYSLDRIFINNIENHKENFLMRDK